MAIEYRFLQGVIRGFMPKHDKTFHVEPFPIPKLGNSTVPDELRGEENQLTVETLSDLQKGILLCFS